MSQDEHRMYIPFTDNYRCSSCGAEQCKLWRHYMVTASAVDLLCASCALRDQKVEGMPNADGKRIDSLDEVTCRIGDLIPAIPCEDRDTFWGYSMLPSNGLRWWRSLPTITILMNREERELDGVINELADLMSPDGGILAFNDPITLLNRIVVDLKALRTRVIDLEDELKESNIECCVANNLALTEAGNREEAVAVCDQLRIDLAKANTQRAQDEQDLWCLRESFRQLAERAPEICKGSTSISTVVAAIDELNRLCFYTAELKAELNQQKDSLTDSTNNKKYIVYFSVDPLPLNAPLEYFTESTAHVADLVGTFKAADKNTAMALAFACERAEKQWGWYRTGGYFAAFLVSEHTPMSDALTAQVA